MSIAVGAALGSHEITGLLGKGGMGEVYRARDVKLKREVAIKVLPEEFSRDGERVGRFQREAELLASLNHPNIGGIYDLQEANGYRFLVLELIEGQTLAERITRSPLPVEEALQIACQICEALEAAHEKGVVHRDLKPANVKITSDGKVKVLDFGLAKAMESGSAGAPLSHSPTLINSYAATSAGVIMGTAAYMSPEQARGQGADQRSDVFSFGCVLYEMLTGRQAFQGETVTDILASILARDADYSLMDARLHPRVKETLRRCLEKDRRKRWQAIGDVRLELEQVLTAPGQLLAEASTAAQPSRRTMRMILPWAASALIAGAAAAWALKPRPAPDVRPLIRFDYELPEGQQLRGTGRSVIAVSPNGKSFVYNTNRGLYVRSMDAMAARVVPGTEQDAITNPFFSPDGEWVGYWSGGEIRKIAISGGAPVTLCKAPANLAGAQWNINGSILFWQPAGIMRVSSDGGEPKLIVPAEGGEVIDGSELLPDDDTVIFSSTRAQGANRWDQAQIVAYSLKAGKRKILMQGGSDARYAPSGHLVYAVGSVLFAAPFDLQHLAIAGGPVPIIQGVQRAAIPAANTATANYGFSDGGALIYLTGVPTVDAPNAILGIVDQKGAVRRLNVPYAQYRNPRISPDGHKVAVETTTGDNGQSTIWIYDLDGKTAIRRLTEETNNSTRPIWTPDSKRITFASDREKAQGIYWQPADGSALPERLTTAPAGITQFPESWSPDGRVLSFAAVQGGFGAANWSLWTLSLEPKSEPKLFYDRPNSNEFGSVFSPDGKWIAYASNEGPDSQFGIYVQPFPPTGVKYLISQSGGAWPVWSANGKELFYRLNSIVTNQPKLNAVQITTNPVPAFGSEASLSIRDFLIFTNYRDYDVLPKGGEFVMIFPEMQTVPRDPPRPRIQVVLNWFEELKQRVSPH